MEDVSTGLYEAIKQAFDKEISKSKELSALMKRVEEGTATHKDSYRAAEIIGEALAEAFQSELSSSVLPDGHMYWNIGKKVVEPFLTEIHEQIGDITADIQEALNTAAGLGLKAARPELDLDRIKGFLDRLDSEPDFDKAKWILDAPVENYALHTVDETIEANADWHWQAGLKPKIVRISTGRCCDWCEAVAGTYEYPNVPQDVYRRHDNCRCIVTYDPGDGSRRNVWTKRLQTESEGRIMEERKVAGLDVEFQAEQYISDLEKVNGVAKDVVAIAKSGGRHEGTYRKALVRTRPQLQKSIVSHTRQVDLHTVKIENPGESDALWETRDERSKRGLLKKWAKDRARNAEEALIELAVWEERFKK